MNKTLFDQLGEIDRGTVASLCNTTGYHHGFQNMLREIPALAEPFTIGDAARAYVAVLQYSIEKACKK